MGREIKPREIRSRGRIVVLGEGICETYYLQSLQGVVNVTILPKIYKDGIDNLRREVEKAIANGYEKIFCLIDTDNKQTGKTKTDYDKFHKEYSNPRHENRMTGEVTIVTIIENQPCLEIWLYYYFKHTTASYCSYDALCPLKPDLIKELPLYEKTEKFLKNIGGLHSYLLKKGGDFNCALSSSVKSMEHLQPGNSSAFSEMKRMFDEILKEEEKAKLPVYRGK